MNKLLYDLISLLKEGKMKKAQPSAVISDRYTIKSRTNLNDLLKKRSEEKNIDRKKNYIIYSIVGSVSVVVLLILSL